MEDANSMQHNNPDCKKVQSYNIHNRHSTAPVESSSNFDLKPLHYHPVPTIAKRPVCARNQSRFTFATIINPKNYMKGQIWKQIIGLTATQHRYIISSEGIKCGSDLSRSIFRDATETIKANIRRLIIFQPIRFNFNQNIFSGDNPRQIAA